MLNTGKYVTRVNGLGHRLGEQDHLGPKVWLIAVAKRDLGEKLTTTNHNQFETPRLTKLGLSSG
jgi:hypothetical protein